MTGGRGTARILMVDDRPENLMALEAILEPLEHELVRANSGEEALRQVLLHDFAVILLDVQMPGMNGFETAQLIKSRERSRFTPIIFLTAISKEDQFVYAGYSVGAVDYMFKPFNPDVLRSKVAVFVDLYLKTEQLKDQEQRLRESEIRELDLQHRARLMESEARLAEIVGSAMEAIVTFAEDGRITLFNSASERTFGVKARKALGQPFEELLAEEERPRLSEICVEAAERAGSLREGSTTIPPQGVREHSLMGRRASGDQFPLEASISCLQLDTERVFTVIGRDVSERKRAEEELRQQALHLSRQSEELQRLNEQLQHRQRELENAMSARSRFYASMSHELRTPINAILGYSSLLLDDIYGPLSPEQARGIERANAAAKHLLELVNDILDLSKIEAGKLDLEIQTANFPSVVHDLFVTVRPLADEHGSELSLEATGQVTVTTDPRRVRQILLNLLSNAIKFGEGNPITVSCQPTEEGGVNVLVIDRGRGIEPENLERIFDEFVQLEGNDQQHGTGLGLPISRRLAVLLGGALTVESTVAEGSTFTLTLPPKLDVRLLSADMFAQAAITSEPPTPAAAVEALHDAAPAEAADTAPEAPGAPSADAPPAPGADARPRRRTDAQDAGPDAGADGDAGAAEQSAEAEDAGAPAPAEASAAGEESMAADGAEDATAAAAADAAPEAGEAGDARGSGAAADEDDEDSIPEEPSPARLAS